MEQIKDIFYSLKSRDPFSEEQKGCRKGTRDTRELQNYDQHIVLDSMLW